MTVSPPTDRSEAAHRPLLAPRIHLLVRQQRIARPVAEVFEFFAEARNLERITPAWLGFTLTGGEPADVHPGTLLAYRLRLHGIPLRWVSEIEVWEPGRAFVDRQVHGPYRLWRHRHEFAATAAGTIMRDEVRYALPLGPVGELAHQLFVRRDLEQIFDFRRRAVAEQLG